MKHAMPSDKLFEAAVNADHPAIQQERNQAKNWTVADRLRRLFTELDCTYEEAAAYGNARATGIILNASYLHQIAAGVHQPRSQTIDNLSKVFEISRRFFTEPEDADFPFYIAQAKAAYCFYLIGRLKAKYDWGLYDAAPTPGRSLEEMSTRQLFDRLKELMALRHQNDQDCSKIVDLLQHKSHCKPEQPW